MKYTPKRQEDEKEERRYNLLPICTYKLMPSKWDDDNNEEELTEDPKMVTVMSAPSPQQYKPYKSSSFVRMLNKLPPRFTPINQKIRDIIMAQQEMNQAIRCIPQQKLIDEVE